MAEVSVAGDQQAAQRVSSSQAWQAWQLTVQTLPEVSFSGSVELGGGGEGKVQELGVEKE
jgi:hypothetical protein